MAAAVVVLLLLPVVAGTGGRRVSLQYNPGWNGSSVNVLHVRAVGAADTLHYVWSSIGGPAVLLLATRSSTSALGIDWDRLLSPAPAGAVWIEPPGSVTHAAAVVFTKVFEYSETGAQKEFFYPTYDLSDFSWASINHTLNHTALTAEFSGVPAADPSGSFSNGSLAFRVTAYEAGGRDEVLPSLLHTANSSKVEFILAGVAPRGNGSRFVLEVAAVEEPGLAPALRVLRSIDDEYTPTVCCPWQPRPGTRALHGASCSGRRQPMAPGGRGARTGSAAAPRGCEQPTGACPCPASSVPTLGTGLAAATASAPSTSPLGERRGRFMRRSDT
ncbi:glycosylated lysosomal membrane protein isoform X2 [Melopsittacus undulatus]|uniref:glycosylated lysosomal membrane protein isoform X2 n=1 Tax=Melopsittacus undulatus TaxID=13146 RepID=UPI00146C077F|nr:glycosylated lysosomal membrane protein isoform X2 [Melopsittacus undulatus]